MVILQDLQDFPTRPMPAFPESSPTVYPRELRSLCRDVTFWYDPNQVRHSRGQEYEQL
jgi:hypothetical protein